MRLTDSHTVPFSTTHPYDHRQQRQHREQAGREASWLKQVRKAKRGGQSEKWVTRPRGGRSKKNFGEKKLLIGATVECNRRKDLITYVDKPTTVPRAARWCWAKVRKTNAAPRASLRLTNAHMVVPKCIQDLKC